MVERLVKELENQRKLAMDMGVHLKEFAATYDMNDDKERHHLRLVAAAYIDEQTRYEYMKLQSHPQTSPLPEREGGMVGLAHGVAA